MFTSPRLPSQILPNFLTCYHDREWRMKWSHDEDKKSLVAAQKALEEVLPAIRAIPGFKSVQRVVCGGCQDFKVRGLWKQNQWSKKTFIWQYLHIFAGHNLTLRWAFRSLGSDRICARGYIHEIARDDWRAICNRDPNIYSYDDVMGSIYLRIGLRQLSEGFRLPFHINLVLKIIWRPFFFSIITRQNLFHFLWK